MAYKNIKIPENGSKISIENGVLTVPDNPIIPFIEGDGIGVDITPAMIDVVNNAVEKLITVVKRLNGWKFIVVKNLLMCIQKILGCLTKP